MRVYILLFLLSFVFTFLCVPLVRFIAIRTGAITAVRARDIHQVPTPRLGGVAMLIGFLAVSFFADQFAFVEHMMSSSTYRAIEVGAILITLLGALDDYFDIDWMLKLAGQALIALYVTMNGVQLLSLPLGGVILASPQISIIFTVVLIVLSINAVNFVDGLDGLAAGIIAIGAGFFFIYSYTISQIQASYASLATYLVAVTCGIAVGFLVYNFPPAKIFMGDSGSMLLGFLFSSSSLLVTGHVSSDLQSVHNLPGFIPILLPIVVICIPIIDMLLAVVRRLAQGKSPFSPDKEHLHHRMLRLGHSHRGSVLIIYSWSFAVCACFTLLLFFRLRYVLLASIVVFGILLLTTFAPKLKVSKVFQD